MQGVLLLHGLARTKRSMAALAGVLCSHGYHVLNQGYPSRTLPVRELAFSVLPAAVEEARRAGAAPLHVVTHSMGGILLRAYLAETRLPELGRVVMLSPPNRGSEVVDRLGRLPGFALYNGPAGLELGTGPDSLPNRLGRADFCVGVITGSRSWDPVLSRLLPKPNDGKVSVERARLEGMTDFLVLPYGHTFIMRRREVIRQVTHFLRHGRFDH